MANLSTAQITGIVTLALVLTGVIVVENLEKSYYCASEDNVKECLRVSSSGITCYYLAAEDITKGDRCTGGVWEPLTRSIPQVIETPGQDSTTKYSSTDNCIIKGKWCYCNPRGSLDNKRLC